MEIITVATFPNCIDANITANYLHQHNINCFLVDEYNLDIDVVPLTVKTKIVTKVMVDKKDLNHSKIVLSGLYL